MDTDDWLVKRIPAAYRPTVVIGAGIVLQFTYGIVYTFGNILPYLVSYLRWKVDPTQTSGSMIWLQSAMSGIPCSMLLGGYLERKVGARMGALIGSTIYTCATLTSYYTIQHSYFGLLVTLGLFGAFGQGIAYNCVLIQAQRWLPKRVGLASGLIAAGFGCGAFLMSPIQTKFINPQNYQVNSQGYFTQIDLLERVPQLFLLLGGIFGVLQFVALFFIAQPKASPDDDSDNESLLSQDVISFSDAEYDVNTITARETLTSSTFILLFVTLYLNAAWVQISSGLFKAFGMKFIKDDFFLASVSSFAAMTNCLSRVAWGMAMDKTSYQSSMSVAAVTGAALMWTLPYIKYMGDRTIFFFWICAMFSIIGATYTLIPSAVHKCFGSKNFGIAYGVIQISITFSGITSAVCSQLLLPVLGYERLFLIIGSCLAVSFVLTTLIQKTEFGNPMANKSTSHNSTETIGSVVNPNYVEDTVR